MLHLLASVLALASSSSSLVSAFPTSHLTAPQNSTATCPAERVYHYQGFDWSDEPNTDFNCIGPQVPPMSGMPDPGPVVPGSIPVGICLDNAIDAACTKVVGDNSKLVSGSNKVTLLVDGHETDFVLTALHEDYQLSHKACVSELTRITTKTGCFGSDVKDKFEGGCSYIYDGSGNAEPYPFESCIFPVGCKAA